MSWLYSRVLVEEFSEANSSAGERSAQSNTTPTPQAYCSQDRMMELCRLSRFGMTFGPLTESRGEELLAWCLGVFRARTSVPQDEAQGSAARNQASGWKWRESSVKYDHDSRLWKIRQRSLLEDSEWFSETWPRWGLMRDGESWELPMSARPTFGSGSGLWPTPNVPNGGRSIAHCDDIRETTAYHKGKKVQVVLESAVKMWPTIRSTDADRGGRGDLIQAVRGNANSHYRLWPTPQARDHFPPHKPEYIARKRAEGHGMSNLNDVVATPTARDWKSGKASQATMEKNAKPLSEQIGGSLNPDWVELLMGWPKGWTSLEPLESAEMRGWPDDWEEGVPRVEKGIPARVQRLKAIGNGQVPQCAAMAWGVLTEKTQATSQ